jgi:hypothetical protein
VEVRDSVICNVRYSHHEDHVRAKPHGIWQPPVHAVHRESDRLRNDLERAATLVWGIAGQEGEDG